MSFKEISVISNVDGLVECAFENAATTTGGVQLDVRLTITSLVNGASYIDGNGPLVNGGQGLGGSGDLGASTFDADTSGADETLFFVIDEGTDVHVSMNLRFVRNDDKTDFNLTETIFLQSFDIDKGQTSDTYSDTFGWVGSQTTGAATFSATTNLGFGTPLVTAGETFTTARLGPGTEDSSNINNDPSDPLQIDHTVELRYDNVPVEGIDLSWGVEGENTTSRRGMFLSGQNPPLIQVPEPSVVWLMVGTGLLILRRRR